MRALLEGLRATAWSLAPRFKRYFEWFDRLLSKPQALLVYGDAETIAFAAGNSQKGSLELRLRGGKSTASMP